MEKKRNFIVRTILWLAIPVAVVAGLIFFLYREQPLPVTAVIIERGHVEDTVTSLSSGTVMSTVEAMIAAEIMGKVVDVSVEEGDLVRAGDVLIELNHTELDAQMALAEANLRVGQSRLEQVRLGASIYKEVSGTQVGQTRAQLDNARREFTRLQSLYDRGAISRSALEHAELALRVAEEGATAALAGRDETQVRDEEIRSAEATLEQLEASVQLARAILDKAFIRAPFDGVVVRTLVEEGEAVTPGIPLMRLVNREEVYVEAPFDEANAADVEVGQRVRLGIDAYREQEFKGEVAYISPIVSLNPDLSRTLNVKVRILEGQEKFLPGMSVDVIILVNEKDNVPYIPSETLIREQFAYVIRSNGRVERREIETGVGNWNRKEILSGLEVGDTIVRSVSLKGLDDGRLVTIVDELPSP